MTWEQQAILLKAGVAPRWDAPGPRLRDRMIDGPATDYPTETCVPSMWEEQVILDDNQSFDVHFGVCLGCGWVSKPTYDGTEALAWAHDHTHPGWRDLPVLPRSSAWNTARAKGKGMDEFIRKQMENAGYPEGWVDDPWAPILTERGEYGTRCVPRYNHASLGYDMADAALEVEPMRQEVEVSGE